MRTNLWLRILTCSMAFSAGSLQRVESMRAAEPPALEGEQQAAPSESAVAAALLGSLSPEHMKSLGEMLDTDWKDRPEWGDMAVAIMKGDFMRPNVGWWMPGSKRYDWNWLRDRFDANQDGKIDRDELKSKALAAEQLFDRLDRNADGQLMADEFDYSESFATDLAAMKNRLFNQLFSRVDRNSNGRITLEELADFFGRADQEGLGFLTPEDLRLAIDDSPKPAAGEAADRPASTGPSTPAIALGMLLRNELGWLGPGPKLNDVAPDFTLPAHDGSASVKLSDSFGKRPVVLVFGSFT